MPHVISSEIGMPAATIKVLVDSESGIQFKNLSNGFPNSEVTMEPLERVYEYVPYII